MHLLIVEDDAETASYMRKGLTEAGYTVDHADNASVSCDLSCRNRSRDRDKRSAGRFK